MPVIPELELPSAQPPTTPTAMRQSQRARKPSQKLRSAQSDPTEQQVTSAKRSRDKSSDFHTPQRKKPINEPNSANSGSSTILCTTTGSSTNAPKIKWVKPRDKGSPSHRRSTSHRRINSCDGRLDAPSYGKPVSASKPEKIGPFNAFQSSESSRLIPNPLYMNVHGSNQPSRKHAAQAHSRLKTIQPQRLVTDVVLSDNVSHNNGRTSPELTIKPNHSQDMVVCLPEAEFQFETVNREVFQSKYIGSIWADMSLEENPGFSLDGHDTLMDENGRDLFSTAPQYRLSLLPAVTDHVKREVGELIFEEAARRMYRGVLVGEEPYEITPIHDESQELLGIDGMMRGEPDNEDHEMERDEM